MKWLTFAMILVLLVNQIPLLVLMIEIMGWEWIVSLFLSAIYLLFPVLHTFFLFNLGFQKNLLVADKFWSIWFYLLFQIASLVSYSDLLIGNFANYFQLPRDGWTEAMVVYQDICYGWEILLFSAFVISLSIDYGLVL